ncbi:PfkB family carbohydrate kinase [Proteiniclasticum sp. QWL-01]|uniref:PfkB family carbohydrate kinase n=1 Tax=Proteiniclasticum sp. QWL-01 TaxID=3036945 RepID=UPI00240EF01A|nr:PfkB family carbohydrate kinase [Proteiniclasticum sp. QWL-01]WFF72201.1 PfkB family carbohydrate kinase [Proteiniclasticum sp. QWL-01]
MKLICIGDNVCDCYHYKNTYYPGGNCVNVAVNAKRSGAEKCSYIGILGTDDKAQHVKFAMDQEGIEWSRSRTMEGLTGQPGVYLDESGDRIFRRFEGDTVQTLAKLHMTRHDLAYVKDYDLCHTSCYSWMEEELPVLCQVIEVSYDFSDHYTLEQIDRVAPYICYAFLSASDRTQEEIAALIKAFGKYPNVKVLGMTRGKEGALFVSGGKEYRQAPAPAQVVDTMGAGDSFIAAFLVSHKNGLSMEESLSRGTLSAAKTCELEGGFGYPHDII